MIANGDVPGVPDVPAVVSDQGEIPTNERIEEKVSCQPDPSNPNRHTPRIAVTKIATIDGKETKQDSYRNFEGNDMARVLDYDQVPDPPQDAPLMYCVGDAGLDNLEFPMRHFRIRGGYLFFFDLEDVEDDARHYVSFHAPPLGVVPLHKIKVQFPPGGRRVFREHTETDARNGYELVILLPPNDDGGVRPAAFLVADSLGQREKWTQALRARAEVKQDTKLRAAYAVAQTARTRTLTEKSASVAQTDGAETSGKQSGRASMVSKKKIDQKRFETEDEDIQDAVQEFAMATFSSDRWIDEFFEVANDFDAPTKCRQMEQWQMSLRRGLKGAVMEQYEYFVEASAEMTTMGQEVISLKNMVETQVETIKEMQEIVFAEAQAATTKDELMGDSDDEDMFDRLGTGGHRNGRRHDNDDQSDMSSVSSVGDSSARQGGRATDEDGREIEIPSWLDDVGEEVIALLKENRYTDATDLWSKAKSEASELLQRLDHPTRNRVVKKRRAQLQQIQKDLDEAAARMSGRIAEGLRRKNEALKQAAKRERADPQSIMAPMVSPCCLDDDVIPLQLLVRLGKTQEAAEAYAARRSLLLLESLHERPIAGLGNVDLVIYAAQLSQSFFSSLARAVEGFLDLFLTDSNSFHGHGKEDSSLEDGSILSHTTKNIPAGAIASVVLWCETELSKFANAFGGSRILGNLALSPPPRDTAPKGPRVLGQNDANGSKERQNAIELAAQCVDQAFLYASENLDTVGLPLTPRLAEYVRSRLKGCESEVAALMDSRWRHITLDWESKESVDDSTPLRN